MESQERFGGRTPEELRREAMELLREQTGEAIVGLNVVRVTEGQYFYTFVRCIGHEQLNAAGWGLEGHEVLPALEEAIQYPDDSEVGSFARYFDRAEARDDTAGDPEKRFQQMYGRFGIVDEARMLVYDEREFAGWIGVFRDEEAGRLTEGDVEALNGHVEPVRRRIIAAHRIEMDEVRDGSIVMKSGGRVAARSQVAGDWLTDARRRLIVEWIKQLETGVLPQARVPFVDGKRLRLERLQSNDGELKYLVHLVSHAAPLMRPEARLTPTQREVAHQIASGATAEEIAEQRHRSVHTIRTHVRDIYERLGIGSRFELLQLIWQGRSQ